MRDGTPISESSDYDANNPYLNRDPRLGNSIIYNGMLYVNNSGVKTQILTYTSTGSTIQNTTSDAYTSADLSYYIHVRRVRSMHKINL